MSEAELLIPKGNPLPNRDLPLVPPISESKQEPWMFDFLFPTDISSDLTHVSSSAPLATSKYLCYSTHFAYLDEGHSLLIDLFASILACFDLFTQQPE